MKDAKVMGSREVDAMLGYEQKKQMAGCTDTSCMVAIGGALGVDKILMGSVGKLGNSYTLNLKLINIKEGNIEELYSKRIKGGSEEDFLDIMPEALATIFPASASTWIKGQKGPVGAAGAERSPPDPIQVVDLQRTIGQVKVPVKKDEPPVAKAEAPRPPGARQDNDQRPAPAIEKQVPPPEDKEGPYSHAGKFLVGAKGLFIVPSFNAAGEVFLGYGIGQWVELGAAGIVSSSFGGALRVQSFVYNPDGMLKPFIAVQVPYYQTPDGGIMGVGGAPGVQVDFSGMFGVTAEVRAEYYFSAPAGYKSLLVFALAGAQARF